MNTRRSSLPQITGSFFSKYSFLGEVALYKIGSDQITQLYRFSVVAEMASTPTPKLNLYTQLLPLGESRYSQFASKEHM
jgi:hypothetical protein